MKVSFIRNKEELKEKRDAKINGPFHSIDTVDLS
jgi:hypothetical protein